MIKGLTVTVPAAELKTLCLERAKYHDTKQAHYEKALGGVKLAEGDDEENRHSNDPKMGLQQSVRKHQAAAAELRFIAEHLEPEEKYQLERGDLTRLGIAASAY